MVPGFAGTFRAFSIADTVRGFSRGSTTAPWSLHRMMFPRAVRFSSIIVTRATVERSLEISSSVAMYGSRMELELRSEERRVGKEERCQDEGEVDASNGHAEQLQHIR